MAYPPVDPPSGQRWALHQFVSATTGELAPGQNLNRWPAFNGVTTYGYGTNHTPDLPNDDWWIEDWHYIQYKAYLDSVEIAQGNISPGIGAHFPAGEVSPESISYNPLAAGGTKPFWTIDWYGYPVGTGGIGAGVVSVQVTDIRIDAWVAVDDTGTLPRRPRTCAPTTINECGGGLQPIALPSTPDDLQPNFQATIVRRNEASDRAGPLVGAVRGLTWPRYALTGAATVLTQVERRLFVTHSPPSEQSETRYTARRIPGYTAMGGTPLYFTVGTSLVGGPDPIA